MLASLSKARIKNDIVCSFDGCETQSLMLREEIKTERTFENRKLRIFGHKVGKETEDCRKIITELRNLYYSPNVSRVIK